MRFFKPFALVLAVIFCLLSTGCAKQEKQNINKDAGSVSSLAESVTADNTSKSEQTVDLTALSSTMVYSEVYNMVNTPKDYIGKTVRMRGSFNYMKDDKTGNEYFMVLISDATACCQQGLEFVLSGKHTYPDDYPAVGTEIEVTGTFETYMEGTDTYSHLTGSEMKVSG